MHFSSLEPLESRIAPAVILVTSLADDGSSGTLRVALVKANAEPAGVMDSIVITKTGTLTLTSALPVITHDLDISSKAGAGKVIISGDGGTKDFRILSISGTGVDVTLRGLTLTNGHATNGDGGALLIDDTDGKVLIDRSVVQNSTALGSAGGYLSRGGDATGGGISIHHGNVIIQGSKITGNTVTAGAGATGFPGFYGYGYNGSNGYNGYDGGLALGGGIFNQGTLTLKSSTVTGNAATGGAGGTGGRGGDGGYNPYVLGEPGGAGGEGGTGGIAYGGGIQNSGALTVLKSTLSGNTVTGGAGGTGGLGGNGAAGGGSYGYTALGGLGGNGGNGGLSAGGALSSVSLLVTDQKTQLTLNRALAGKAGTGGANGINGANEYGSPGLSYAGYAGAGYGGGLFVSFPSHVNNTIISKNKADTGGGVYTLSGYAVVFHQVTISGNTAVQGGGFAGPGTIDHSTISNNTAAMNGGGVLSIAGSLVVSKSKITGNTAGANGGGGFSLGYYALGQLPGSLSVNGSTVSGNSAVDGGGLGGSNISIAQSVITKNHATHDGGGLLAQGLAMTIVQSKITGNTAVHDGGGLHASATDVILSASTVSGNMAADGAGLSLHHGPGVYNPYTGTYYGGGSLSITRSVISHNKVNIALGKGGGIFTDGGLVSLETSTVDSNQAHDGGGVFIAGGHLFADFSTISRNFATGAGGGVTIDHGDFFSGLHLSTIALNRSIDNGAGFNLVSSVLELDNDTVAANRSGGTGGGARLDSQSSLFLVSTIIAKNTAAVVGNDIGEDLTGLSNATVFADHSLVQAIAGFTLALGNQGTANLFGIDPKLGRLGHHGGPTETMLISIRSGAVDAGLFVLADLTDQRGGARVRGFTLDIGAVEVA